METKNKFWLWGGLGVAVLAVVVFAAIKFGGTGVDYGVQLRAGIEAYNRGDFPVAKVSLDAAIGGANERPVARFYLGKIALGKTNLTRSPLYPDANYADAAANFEEALSSGLEQQNKGLYVVALNDLGFSSWMLKQYQKADDYFIKHIAANPGGAYSSRYFLATDYFERFNRPKDALGVLLPAVSADLGQGFADFKSRNDFRVYSLISRLYSYDADDTNAEKYAKLAIAAGGSDNKDLSVQIAHNVLAVVYARSGEFSSAEKEIKISNMLAGSPTANTCILASAYVAGKGYEKAITTAKSVSGANDYLNSICVKALADANLALGNKAEAKKYYGEYAKWAEALAEKNIFVVRGLAVAREALKGL